MAGCHALDDTSVDEGVYSSLLVTFRMLAFLARFVKLLSVAVTCITQRKEGTFMG